MGSGVFRNDRRCGGVMPDRPLSRFQAVSAGPPRLRRDRHVGGDLGKRPTTQGKLTSAAQDCHDVFGGRGVPTGPRSSGSVLPPRSQQSEIEIISTPCAVAATGFLHAVRHLDLPCRTPTFGRVRFECASSAGRA